MGLQIVQNMKTSVTVNVNRRLAKTNSRTWQLMSKAWARHSHIHVQVHRELINSVTKPSLLSGLQALTIPDNGLTPLVRYQEKMLRRTGSFRKKSSVVLLEMIMQITPLLGDYHLNVFSLLYNVWVTRGPCYELMLHLLKDKNLKSLYWPMNVAKMLEKYDMPDPLFILESEPIEKVAFKNYVKSRVRNYQMEESEGKILRSSLYRFVYKDDFSYNRKKLHPLVTAATTRRQTAVLKLTVLHLSMEYPNSQNRFRIKVTSDPYCKICKEEGSEKIDSTEHNLFTCVCIQRDEGAAKLRMEILTLIATLKGINPVTFNFIIESDIHQSTLLFLNPSSTGIDKRLRIDINSPYIKLIFLKVQNYVLYVHNCRRQYGVHLEEKQLGRPRKLSRKKRSPYDNSKGLGGLSSGAQTKMKLITDFFKSNNNSESKNCDSQVGSTQRELVALINSGAWNCIGTATGASILTVSAVLTNDFSQTEIFRTAVVRQHVHKSLIKCLLLFWTNFENVNERTCAEFLQGYKSLKEAYKL